MQFTRKTSYSKSIIGLLIKLFLIAIVFIGIIFLLNKLDFPAPKKTIEKIIPNKNNGNIILLLLLTLSLFLKLK